MDPYSEFMANYAIGDSSLTKKFLGQMAVSPLFITKNPPLEMHMPKNPEPKHHRVQVIVEDLETGETTVFRFPDIENFQIGMVPEGHDEDHVWGLSGYPGAVVMQENSTIATSGILRPPEDGKTCIVQKL